MSVARVYETRARAYRHVWRASVFTNFLNPVLFLAAMGLGLGTLVDRGDATFPGGSYLSFLAPGLLAASAMQAGAGEASWPVMGGIRWQRTFHAALATPVSTTDLVRGYLAWVATRLTMTSVIFVVVMAVFGAVELSRGLLAVPAAVLTGMAFAAPVMGYTTRLERETGLSSLFRFGIMPLYLFSGTFFPISQLPDGIEWLAYATPLWHGVSLSRGLSLGEGMGLPAVAHVVVLVGVALVGLRFAETGMHRRMVT